MREDVGSWCHRSEADEEHPEEGLPHLHRLFGGRHDEVGPRLRHGQRLSRLPGELGDGVAEHLDRFGDGSVFSIYYVQLEFKKI